MNVAELFRKVRLVTFIRFLPCSVKGFLKNNVASCLRQGIANYQLRALSQFLI